MFIDVTARERNWIDVYRLCIGFINPRPIALTSTVAADGRTNLAPFSFYNMVSGNPPVVIVCVALTRDRREKDTLRNIQETPEFVVATVTRAIGPQMVRCAADLPHGESEFDFSGLTPMPAARVRPPLIKESPINIECRVRQIVSMGDEAGSSRVIFGDIVAIHVDERVLGRDGLVDPHRLQTVGRLGGAWYADVTLPYELHIPKPDRT